MADKKPYVEVRALSRGIAVLTELNRVGHARASALARATGIDRTTAYRLLATLESLGLVAQRSSDDEFVLTAGVRGLSDGYTERDHLTRCVTPHLGGLFQQVLWPTDFAIFEQGSMIIRETTHRFSPYSVHRNMIGRSRPLLTSALGRAFLAGASDAQRATVIKIVEGMDSQTVGLEDPGALRRTIEHILATFAARGYAFSVGGTDPRISAIALPLRGPEGARGAINVVFFRSAMSVAEAAAHFLEPLRACIDRIEKDIKSDALDKSNG